MHRISLSLLTLFFVSFSYSDTTSTITGDVNVSGVTVTVTHEPTGSVKSTTTDDSFRFSSLRPGGPYKIVASKTGYSSESLDNIFLVLNDTADFQINLVAVDVEDLTVTASRIGIQASGPGLNITETDILLAPSTDRSFADIVRRDSRIAVSGTFRDSEISALGVSPRMNNFTVDGTEANDSFGLNDNGFASIRNPIALETLAQIRVDFAPYSVTKGNFGGVAVNAITKSGTNEFKGKFYGRSIDNHDVGSVNGNRPNQFDDETKGFIFGGPIIKDKAFFFLAYEESERLSPSESRAIDPADEAELLQIEEFLNTRYNYSARGVARNWPIFDMPPETAESLIVKLDYNINENNRLEFMYQDTQENQLSPYDRPSQNYVFAAHYYDIPIDRQKSSITWFSDVSDNLSLELQYLEIDYINDNESLGGEDFGHHRITLSSGARAYPTTDQYRSFNKVMTEESKISLKAIYTAGNHTITAGYGFHEKFLYNAFIAYGNGRWRWNSVDDFLTGGDADGELSYFRGLLVPSGNQEEAAAAFDTEITEFYIEDTIDVSDILTVSFGVRVDTAETITPLTYTPAFFDLTGIRNDSGLDSEIVQPRASFDLDVSDLWFGESDFIDSAQFEGGIGIFSGKIPFVWLAPPFGADSGMTTVFTGQWMLGDYQTGVNGFDWRDYYDGTQLHTLLDLDVGDGDSAQALAPGLELPSDLKMSLDLTLYTKNDYKVKLSYIKTDVKNAFRFVDMGVEPSGVYLTTNDGRNIYNSGYTRNIMTFNTSKGGSDSFTIDVSKNFDNGVNAFAGYTYVDRESLYDSSSSQMTSNYRGLPRIDALQPEVGPSRWAQKHRFVAGMDYTFNAGSKYPTTISAFYSAYSGRPYSHAYRDFYQDGEEGLFDRDWAVLAYIPEANDPNVVYDGVDEATILAHIDSLGLSQYAGGNVPKNVGTAPYYRSLDIRILQELPGLRENDKFTIYLDMLNFLNYLDEEKGIRQFTFSTTEILRTSGYNSDGQIVITGTNNEFIATDFDRSSYRFQLGFSYEF